MGATGDDALILRPVQDGDVAVLIAGRDPEFHRFLGGGSDDPRPTAVIEVDGSIVGWVDHEGPEAHEWLAPHQCNIGYHVFAEHRGRGHATGAVRRLLARLADEGACTEAVFLVDADNLASLHVARAVGAVEQRRRLNAQGRPQVLLVRPIPSPPT